MDAIEKAIRGAFERGDPEDPAYRGKVYRSVTAALEKAIVSNAALAPDAAERRRTGLRATIEMVESEFQPAQLPPSPELDEADDAAAELHVEDDDPIAEPLVDAPGADPEWQGLAPEVPSIDDFDAPPPLDDLVEMREPVIAAREPRRRGRLAFAFIAVTLVTVAAMGAWFAMDTGFMKSDAERDTSVPNPPQTLPAEEFQPSEDTADAPAAPAEDAADAPATPAGEDFQPPEEPAAAPAKPAEAEALTNWTNVFSPADPTTARAPAEASAEIAKAGDKPVLRIRSGATGAAVMFDVGQDVLEKLRGKKAVFDVTAKSEEGKPTQMSVICNFGEMGDCGRKRYAVGVDPGEFLFEIDMPQADPGAAGTIAIVSDVDNAGKAVEIFAIRVSTPAP